MRKVDINYQPNWACAEVRVTTFALKLSIALLLFLPFGSGGDVLAQSLDVRAGLAKSVWTAETIRAVRAGNDYKALIALVVTEAAAKANLYPSAEALKQAIAKAQLIADAAPKLSLDPDLNPAGFREVLQRLENSGVIPEDTLNKLIRELSRSPAELTEEDIILREATVATKATFANFMQQHVMAVYDLGEDIRVRSILTNPVGDLRLPDTRSELTALINQSHLPEGDVKNAIIEIATSGTVNADRLDSAAKTALRTATNNFDDARNVFQSIVSGQPRFDSTLSVGIPPAIQERVAAAKKLISSTPEQLQQFDTLQTVANLLPLPPDVSNTIQRVAQIGSAIQSTVSTVSHVASSLSTLGSVANLGMSFLTTGGFGALAGSLGSIFGGGGPSNQEILDAINRVGQQVQQMHAEMVSRFDQVDRELKIINNKIDNGFATLGAQLADLHTDVRILLATTSAIELALLQDRDTLQRAVINNIGAWNENDLKELNRNLVKLLSAIDRADSHVEDLTRGDFRTLALYFTTLAKTEAARFPLTGVQTAEEYNLGFAATRLSRQSGLYPLNYTMSFPVAGVGTATFQNLLSGPESTRDVRARPYVNERVWAIAANAVATMVERWPNFANEIPGLRNGFDGMVNNGTDLRNLVKAVQTSETPPTKVLSRPFSTTFQVYQAHANAFSIGLRNALRDEALSLARAENLNQEQTAALTNAFLAVSTVGDKQIDAVSNGVSFVKEKMVYNPPPLNALLCNGQGPAHQISGAALTGFGLQRFSEALVLKTGVLSACLEIPYYISERQATVPNHGGYGIVGQGAPCAADTVVTFKTLTVAIKFMFRLASDPDDPAHRAVIAEATVTGPETEVSGRIIGQPHWSGQPTEEGHDWNSECHGPNAWHIGDTNGFYIGDPAYIDRNWSKLLAGFSSSHFQVGTFPYASRDYLAVSQAMSSKDNDKFLAIYSNLFSDLTAVLHQPTPTAQNRIVDIATIVDEVHSLEGLRALLRELTTIAYERTVSRDDVLSGLLFGTESLPGGSELLDSASVCAHGHLSGSVDSCLADFARIPSLRAQRLQERLSLVTDDINQQKRSDSHKLVDVTLDRLAAIRCLVPQTFDGRPDCNVQ